MIHKKSHTYLIDLMKDDYFGEIGFFTDNRRTVSAKSRDFTETYAIHKSDFLEIADDYIHAIVCLCNNILVMLPSHKKCTLGRGELLCAKIVVLYLWKERTYILKVSLF